MLLAVKSGLIALKYVFSFCRSLDIATYRNWISYLNTKCHAESESHEIKKTFEIIFACKKCKKVFRKDMRFVRGISIFFEWIHYEMILTMDIDGILSENLRSKTSIAHIVTITLYCLKTRLKAVLWCLLKELKK